MAANSLFPNRLVDAHCHLNDPAFDLDRDQIINSAIDNEVDILVVPGVLAADWPAIHQLAKDNPHIVANYGLHPLYIEQHTEHHLIQLEAQLEVDPHAVAVGECGLDYMDQDADKVTQLDYFTAQLQIAKQHSLPVVIHARRAVEDTILAIRASGHYDGIVHSYNGSYEQAKRLIDLGYAFSFGGAVTYTRATKLRRLLTQLPLDSLLLETDAPFQPDAGLVSSSRSEPARLTKVLDTLCELRNQSRDALAKQTTDNAMRVFKKLT